MLALKIMISDITMHHSFKLTDATELFNELRDTFNFDEI